MSAAPLNFDGDQVPACEQGSVFRFGFTYEDSEKNLVDLSYYTFRMQIRKNYKGVLITELSSENGRIFIDSNGEVVLFMNSAETSILPPGKYVYDLEMTDTTIPDSTEKLIAGEFVILPEVTL